MRGLKNGADDYVVKPFSSTELLARVEAVLRRSAERPQDVAGVRAGGLEVQLERREVHAGSEVRQLTEREAELLTYLARSPNRAVSRDELLRHVWRVDPRGLDTRTVDMAVVRLREKLLHDGVAVEVVVTVRGTGYMLAEKVEVVLA